MPPLEHMDLTDKVLVWAAAGVNPAGDTVVSAMVELDARLVVRKRQMVNAFGQLVGVDAQVVLDVPVGEGSVVWEGGEDDLPGTASVPEGGLWQVIATARAKDLRGRVTRYEYGLRRFAETMPEVV
jgi:hypothetical protein